MSRPICTEAARCPAPLAGEKSVSGSGARAARPVRGGRGLLWGGFGGPGARGPGHLAWVAFWVAQCAKNDHFRPFRLVFGPLGPLSFYLSEAGARAWGGVYVGTCGGRLARRALLRWVRKSDLSTLLKALLLPLKIHFDPESHVWRVSRALVGADARGRVSRTFYGPLGPRWPSLDPATRPPAWRSLA